MKLSVFLFPTLILLILSGCSSSKKITVTKPVATIASPVVYEKENSFVHIPVFIKLNDIAHFTNQVLDGVIYEDADFEGDNLKMTVWKEAPIGIVYEKGKIKTILPLKANIKYRLGTNRLGFDLYDVREFNLNGTITLLSDVRLTNWNLHSKTKFESLVWKENPTLKLLGRDVPITRIITPAVGMFRTAVEQVIDLAVTESMDFKPNVLDAIEAISKPYKMSDEYDSWLLVHPLELYTTDATLNEDMVTFTMGMKCTLETIIGDEPPSLFDREKIILKPVTHIPDKVTTTMVAISTYKDASRIMTRNLKGETFGSKGKKVSVKNVDIFQHNNKLILALDLSGSINGTIYLSGYPQYNEQTKEIYFDKLEYEINTKSTLLKSANWLASNYILLQLKENFRFSIQPNLDEGKQNIMEYLSDYSPIPGVLVNGNLEEIEFKNLQLTNSAILAFIKINGNISITVDGLE